VKPADHFIDRVEDSSPSGPQPALVIRVVTAIRAWPVCAYGGRQPFGDWLIFTGSAQARSLFG